MGKEVKAGPGRRWEAGLVHSPQLLQGWHRGRPPLFSPRHFPTPPVGGAWAGVLEPQPVPHTFLLPRPPGYRLSGVVLHPPQGKPQSSPVWMGLGLSSLSDSIFHFLTSKYCVQYCIYHLKYSSRGRNLEVGINSHLKSGSVWRIGLWNQIYAKKKIIIFHVTWQECVRAQFLSDTTHGHG